MHQRMIVSAASFPCQLLSSRVLIRHCERRHFRHRAAKLRCMGSAATEQYDYDLITIGAGSGGTRASSCVIRGCVPKKLMWYASAFAEEHRDALGFGWNTDKPKFDIKTLMGKKAKEIARLNGVYNKLLKEAGVTMYEGAGKLVDAHTVDVTLTAGGTKRISAKHILLAVGGRAVKAPIEGSEHAITSDEILVLDELPERAVIVGAGYIALEFAGILNGMGVDTHVMFRGDKPLRGFDDECREQIATNMSGRGLHIYPETKPTKIEKVGENQLVVHYEKDGEKLSMDAGLVLFGTGRKPNTDRLNLEAVGVELNKKGAIVVDQYSHTNVDSIWAIGDVTNRLDLTPVAIMEGMCFAMTVFGDKPTPCIHENIASAVFVQPPMGTCGLTEEQAIERVDGEIDVFVSKFKPMKNTISGVEEKTLMKIIVEVETDRVLGVHVVGPESAEIIQGIAIAMKCNARKAQFDATVGVHPTAAEELVTMRTRARRVRGRGGAANGKDHQNRNAE